MPFHLNLHSNYASHWTVKNAVREFVQNWYDQVTMHGTVKPIIEFDAMSYKATHPKDRELLGEIRWSPIKKELLLINCNAKIPWKAFLMGGSDKDEKCVGKFGEGMKVAALALVRKGHTLVIDSEHERWRFLLQVRFSYP